MEDSRGYSYRGRPDSGYANAIAWYAVVFACMAFEWWWVKRELEIEYSNMLGTMLKCVGDVALILFPYWLLPPRWRWTALLPLWITALWSIANLAYFRFWGDLIPPASITMGGNVDGNLMEYGMALFRWKDIMLLATPCLAWITMRYIKPSASPAFRLRMKWMLSIGSILMGVLGQMAYFKTTYAWRNAISPISVSEGLQDHFSGGYTGQKQLYVYNGPAYYGIRFVYDAIDLLNGSIELSPEQKKDISDFLSHYERKVSADSVSSNTDRIKIDLDSINLVYIIVESLNADMVGKEIGGVKIMPVLDSLARKEGSVVFDNVVSQIKASSSSDGHLLLMTGLLPPDKAAYSIMYGSHNKFPSLADVFPNHHKYLLLADEGVCWNEGNTLRNFGLGEPLTIQDRPAYPVEEFGRDGAMFRQAIKMADTIRQPFFMTLMTISMHIPFKETAWPLAPEIKNAEGLTQMERDYANMCRNTDRYIGEFLSRLPKNTLVVIASDHHQDVASDQNGTTRAFFMAINSGRTERITRTVGQVNLFPAMLDILDIDSGYGGLAPSAFDESVDGTIDSYANIYGKPSRETLDTLRKAYDISDLIIRGDYFK